MMKNSSQICLIRPPAVESFRFATTSITPPLGLAYVASSLLAAGRKVHLIDAVGEAPKNIAKYYKGYLVGLALEDIVARIPQDVLFIGITVVFTHEWPAVVRLIELIKTARPAAKVVLGGEHVTSMPEFSLLTSKADALVTGEGEETVLELANALESNQPLNDILGLCYRGAGDEVFVNKRRPRRTQVDDIPPPAWPLFNLKKYHENRFTGGMYSSSLTVPILATRGCPYQCTYCSSPNMWTPQWIPRDPVKVVDEIESYVTTYGAGNFPFQDLTAIIKKEWIVAFCQEILRRNLKITWQLPTGTRSEAIDFEVADLLKRSGMISMAYAPESGSETTRLYIKKRMKTENLFHSIEAAARAKLNVGTFLVIGFPHDTKEHILENLPFIDRLAREGVTDLSVGFYMALPGTELFHSLYDSGKIQVNRKYFRHILHSLSLWPGQSYCDNLSLLDLTILKLRLFRRFYGAKRKLAAGSARPSLLASPRRALSGFKSGAHNSRLQTAFRNGVTSGLSTLRALLKKGWIPRIEEERLFENWDRVYRRVREKKLAAGIQPLSPQNTIELHKTNVNFKLKIDHEAARSLAGG